MRIRWNSEGEKTGQKSVKNDVCPTIDKQSLG